VGHQVKRRPGRAQDEAAAKEQTPTKRGRIVRIINSPLFLLILGTLLTTVLTFVGFYYHTYTQCVADSREFFGNYISLETELLYRQNEIVSQILNAKSVSELRKSVDQRKYVDPRFKDQTTAEIHTLYLVQSEQVDESGINKSAENEFTSSKPYQRFSPVLYGYIDKTISDADLKDLQQFAAQFGALQIIQFFTRIRSVSEIDCIPRNIFVIMLGEKPVTIQRYDAGSFVEKERLRQRYLSGRNLLPPRSPPAPFPGTSFTPDALPQK
jgi:hypothetical protein